tara:strand:- start:12358 stop:12897 length:540 start_codon:yes stop_codon:yes gene_type:complete
MANTVTQLQEELSYNYVTTCDLSDSLQKIYLTNKAAHLIHPYSKCSNLITQFNNDKLLFRYKKPAQFHSCTDISSSTPSIQTQKIIQNQVRVHASLYTMNLASLYINSNNLHNKNTAWNNSSDRKAQHKKGVDIKHNSYDRYLGRLKSQHLKTQNENTNTPVMGNKTRKFGLINCAKTC